MALARTYGEIAFEKGRWIIKSCEPHVAIRLKQLFPRIPKASPPPFSFPDDLATAADLKWFTDRYPLAMPAHQRNWLRKGLALFEEQQAEVERIFAPDYSPPAQAGLREGQKLRRYQSQLVDMMRLARRVLCADEGGLGKTYEAAGMFLLPDALPAIAVCYPHLQDQWQDKIESFTTLKCHKVKKTKPYSLPDSADVLIFRWSQLAGWADVWDVLKPKSVAFDEVQELRTGLDSQRGMSANRLSKVAGLVLGLTATPIYNWGTEIWNVLHIIRPDVLGSSPEFIREWTAGTGRIQEPKALGTYLREQHAFVRRTREDVGQELPGVSRVIRYVDHDSKTLHSIEDTAHRLALTATTAEFAERGQAVRELDMLVRHATGVAKARQVAQIVRIIVESGERALVYGWHREVYDIWNKELADLQPCMYTGSESPARKAKEIARWKSGDPKPLFASIRSGAGLDELQNSCSVVIFGELDWSPGVHQQCIWRLDREGQTKPVLAIFAVTNDGSDPPMMEVLGLKASEAQQIVDPALGVVAVNTDDSQLQRLVQRYLEKWRAAA